MAKFEIKIHTGDQYKAGTDSNIFVILIGALDKTSEYRLNGRIKGNAFERDKWDTVTLDVSETYEQLGTIYGIIVRSDMKYAGAGWLLDRIEVRNVDAQEQITSTFKIAEWIEDTKSHAFYDASLIALQECKAKERNITSDAIYNVAAGTTMKVLDTVETVIGFHLSETKITEISTKTSVDASGGVSAKPSGKLNLTQLTATVTFALTTVNNKTDEKQSIDQTTKKTYQQEIEFPVCGTAKKYRPVYIENYEDYCIQVGNLLLQVPKVLSRKGAGYIEER